MDTMVKIVFRKNLNLWEALTAASYKGEKLQKFGNDWNIEYGKTKEEAKQNARNFLTTENLIFVN